MSDLFLFSACVTCVFLVGVVAYLIDENQKRRREIVSITDVVTRSNRLLNQLLSKTLSVTVFNYDEE